MSPDSHPSDLEINFGPWGSMQISGYLETALKAALKHDGLNPDDVVAIGNLMKVLREWPDYDFCGASFHIEATQDYGPSGNAWRSISLSQEGLSMSEGGKNRYDYGSDSHSKTVYAAGLEGYPEYDDFSFEMEQWMYQFTNLLKRADVEVRVTHNLED